MPVHILTLERDEDIAGPNRPCVYGSTVDQLPARGGGFFIHPAITVFGNLIDGNSDHFNPSISQL